MYLVVFLSFLFFLLFFFTKWLTIEVTRHAGGIESETSFFSFDKQKESLHQLV
jgi:ATP-dependent Zn protease